MKNDMHEIDIRKLDFTLLSVLSSLLRTRKATDTAAELNMTQSTVSHALARLRTLTGDPLFVRRPHGLDATPRALALAPTLDAIFSLARGVLDGLAFDPSRADGVLRIGAADYHCALMSAPLVAHLAREAPNLRLSFRPIVRKPAVEAMLAGEIDLAIGRFFRLPASVHEQLLFDESYSVVTSQRHSQIRGDPDLDTFCSARHIVVSLDGSLDGVVDSALAEIGRKRTVVAAVPYFLAALAAAATSDVVVTLPSRLAAAYAEPFGLRIHAPPVALRSFKVSAVFPRSSVRDSVQSWLASDVLPRIADSG